MQSILGVGSVWACSRVLVNRNRCVLPCSIGCDCFSAIDGFPYREECFRNLDVTLEAVCGPSKFLYDYSDASVPPRGVCRVMRTHIGIFRDCGVLSMSNAATVIQ